MKFTRRIPGERLSEYDLRTGDTLQVLAFEDSDYVVRVIRDEEIAASSGAAGDWLMSARGSVKIAPGETVDDLRMDYYSRKFGVGT